MSFVVNLSDPLFPVKLSRSWLQDYVDLAGVADDDISRAITFLGFEVEQVIRTGAPRLSNVVVGRILTRDKHPNADKLSVCTVDVGVAQGGVRTIVCGAPNCDAGNRVPVALPGAVLPGDFVIKEAKVRGQPSSGMMCSAKELTIAEDAQGLLLLSGEPEVGTPLNEVLPAGDVVFDIEITPNRPDALSHIGVARELAAWFKKNSATRRSVSRRRPSRPIPAPICSRPSACSPTPTARSTPPPSSRA